MTLPILFNFSIVVAILYLAARKSVPEHFRLRAEKLDQAIRGAERDFAAASKECDAWNTKMQHAPDEAKAFAADAKSSLTRYRETTLAAAKKESERVAKEAVALANTELQRAKESLGRELALRSLRASASYLRGHLEDRDREVLLDQFAGRA